MTPDEPFLESSEHKRDTINHPPHYTHGRIEPIDVIEDWRLDFHLGQVVKYVARAEHKGSPLEDLKKARWYLDREIERRERREREHRARAAAVVGKLERELADREVAP